MTQSNKCAPIRQGQTAVTSASLQRKTTSVSQYRPCFYCEQVRPIPIPRYSAYANVVGQNNKAAIISETKWTLIGHNICFLMSFCSKLRPRERRYKCAHLKCSEPFLETSRWLNGGDPPSLLPLTISCSNVAKCGGCGWTRDDSGRAAIYRKKEKKKIKKKKINQYEEHLLGNCSEVIAQRRRKRYFVWETLQALEESNINEDNNHIESFYVGNGQLYRSDTA